MNHHHQKYSVANVVSCTERGQDFIERAFLELRKKDPLPAVSLDHADSLQKLNEDIEGKDLEAAINAVKEHPYFRKYFDTYTAMLAQVRNASPSDVSIVYRYKEGQFQLQRWLAVALTDPSGPIFVDRRLVPATKDRKERRALQRRVVCVHELADLEELAGLSVFSSIYPGKWESWFAIVAERNAVFTWVLIFWCQLRTMNDIQTIRAGLENLAEPLSRSIQTQLKQDNSALIYGDSLREGILVLSSDFKTVRRQNYAAESIMRRFRDAAGDRLDRSLLYKRFEDVCRRFFNQNRDAFWQVDGIGREAGSGVVALHARLLGGEVVLKLTELTPAPPELLALTGLTEYSQPSGLVSYIKDEQRAVYVPAARRVARPLLEDDLIADRIHQYPTITGTELDERGVAGLRGKSPYALRFRTRLVGVLLPA